MDRTRIKQAPPVCRPGSALAPELADALGALDGYMAGLCGGSPLSVQVQRMVAAGGKRMRPALLWLCGRMGGATTEALLPLMAAVELMHTASLIHDDVIDCADERRGIATIHTSIGAHGAVQAGDFLIARAMSLLPRYQGTDISAILSETFTEMCLGELTQAEAAGAPGRQTADSYYLQIRRKTAYLLAACCQCGALVGGLSEGEVQALRAYGLSLGVAFQLQDDILDFEPANRTGKPCGQDLRRGLYTLPVFYALRRAPTLEVSLLNPIKTEADLKRLIHQIRRLGGLEYTQKRVASTCRAALAALAPFGRRPEAILLSGYARALSGRGIPPQHAAPADFLLRTEDTPS